MGWFHFAFKWELENSREKKVYIPDEKDACGQGSLSGRQAGYRGFSSARNAVTIPATHLHTSQACVLHRWTAHRSRAIEIQQAWIGVLFFLSIHHWNQTFHWERYKEENFLKIPVLCPGSTSSVPGGEEQSVFLSMRAFCETADSSLRQLLGWPSLIFFFVHKMDAVIETVWVRVLDSSIFYLLFAWFSIV